MTLFLCILLFQGTSSNPATAPRATIVAQRPLTFVFRFHSTEQTPQPRTRHPAHQTNEDGNGNTQLSFPPIWWKTLGLVVLGFAIYLWGQKKRRLRRRKRKNKPDQSKSPAPISEE